MRWFLIWVVGYVVFCAVMDYANHKTNGAIAASAEQLGKGIRAVVYDPSHPPKGDRQ